MYVCVLYVMRVCYVMYVWYIMHECCVMYECMIGYAYRCTLRMSGMPVCVYVM